MNKYSPWQTLMGLLLILIVCAVSRRAGALAVLEEYQTEALSRGPLVVLDPGHGGRDPGKVGASGELEKDINLAIALDLKQYLEASDVEVILTRDKDTGLYDPEDSRKKMADMNRRCSLIEEADPDLVVSIHQNSYGQEQVRGGQVFYYSSSEEGEKLAHILQDRLEYATGSAYRRQAKPNESYYLLLHVKQPIVIVECGFLSNPQEAELLSQPEYQDRMAWTLHMGIMEYLNQTGRYDRKPVPSS